MLKTYKIPVHRKISSTAIVKTDTENSDLYLTNKSETVSYINEDFNTKIYSIEKNKKQINIYSNTLNINVTDKFSKNNIPLYYNKVFSTKDEANIFIKKYKEYLIEIVSDDFYVVYYNETEHKIENRYVYIGNPITRTSNVKVRKLKDRFKITINNIDVDKTIITLNSNNIFEPHLYKNYIEFYESFITINNIQYYLYNSSFNLVSKVELSNEPKDPVIKTNNISSNTIQYDSFRSNLLFEEKIKNNYYYYLKLSPKDKTDLILQSTYLIKDPQLVLLFYKENVKNSFKITQNPFHITNTKKPCGDNFTLLFKEAENYKYNLYNNIKISTERKVLDFEQVFLNKIKYLKKDNEIIYQTDPLRNYGNVVVKTKEDIPDFFVDNINDLKQKLEEIYNGL